MSKLGWHFRGEVLRNGLKVPPAGKWLVHDGPVVICESGLHYSERVIDALQYAPSDTTYCDRVEVAGIVDTHPDKGVCRRRRILWTVEVVEVLDRWARRCALDVAHLWDAPPVVVRFLETGDETLRDAAFVAAWAADATQVYRDAAPASAWAAGARADSAANAARAVNADIAAWADSAANAARAVNADIAARADARDRQGRRLTAMVSAAPRIVRRVDQ